MTQPPDSKGEQHAFQVEDDVYLDCQPLQHEGAWQADTRGFCHELLQLRETSLQANHLLATLRKRHPDIGHYLSLLDRKVEQLTHMVAMLGMGEGVLPSRRVTLGTEGLQFIAQEPLATATELRLKLVLFPSHLCLHPQATVIECRRVDTGYLTVLSFKQLEESEREALIRHLLEKQSAALRRGRTE